MKSGRIDMRALRGKTWDRFAGCLLLLPCMVLLIPSARADAEIRFRDLRLRLIGVEENAPDNPRDDTATVIVRTATNSQRLEIPQNTSRFIDEYEIFVGYIRPDPAKPGAGTARITVYGGRF